MYTYLRSQVVIIMIDKNDMYVYLVKTYPANEMAGISPEFVLN
ncbi:MAG: hypothetical protein A4E44_00549 [Methanosaeta sp. PtaB.Bin018]|nr:MAG: hypothetical protein A4E44_00549 [Methanosaeta sp. PtaB.Bin018]OPY43792.1 MAG: hypothetical protein A4E46_01656 [Methanosaeta sp. PtaU1.Bin016]